MTFQINKDAFEEHVNSELEKLRASHHLTSSCFPLHTENGCQVQVTVTKDKGDLFDTENEYTRYAESADNKQNRATPTNLRSIKADLVGIAGMNENAEWGIMAAYGDEGERGPVSLCICDTDEKGSGVFLYSVIDACAQWYRDTPNEARWIAEDLRKLASILDSYTIDAVTCDECGELYNHKALGHCNTCGESNVTKNPPQINDLQKIAERFPIGTPVKYFEIAGTKDHIESVIRSEPWELGHGAIVIKIEGKAGGVSVDPEHLQLIS